MEVDVPSCSWRGVSPRPLQFEAEDLPDFLPSVEQFCEEPIASGSSSESENDPTCCSSALTRASSSHAAPGRPEQGGSRGSAPSGEAGRPELASPPSPPMASVAVAALAHCPWLPSAYRAEFRVQLCEADALTPLCKQKKGGEAKPMSRFFARGSSWEDNDLPASYAFCNAC